MSKEIPIPELAERERNFFTDNTPSTAEQLLYYAELQRVADQIKVDLCEDQGLNKKAILRMIASRIFHFVAAQNEIYSIFDFNAAIYDDAFNASLFTALCMFLYDTKRLKGLLLRRFIYNHSPMQYTVKSSPNYFDYECSVRKNGNYSIISDDTMLRKYRERLFSERAVYNKSPEWSAIRKVSEHEWELYFLLEDADDEIRDTAKRIRNLYNGIYNARKSSVDDLQAAYHKFISKLKKVQYERVLQLNKFFIKHIRKDPICYGINLYRLERMSSLYSLTTEVNRLLKCKHKDERADILLKSVILKDIHFPKLYEYLCGFEDNNRVLVYATAFLSFMRDFVHSSRLVIDKFVDEGMFGEDWENFFLEVINELTKSVLYDTEIIDDAVSPDSQAMFIEIISAPIKIELASRLQNKSFFEKFNADL